MTETFTAPLSEEEKKKREQFSSYDNGVSSEAMAKVENLQHRAARLRKLGARIADASKLREHRRENSTKRKEGLKNALDTRKAAVKEVKKELKFAEKGYGFKDRRFETKMEQRRQEYALSKEHQLPNNGGIFERMASRLERKSIRKEAKARAKAAISNREQQAADNHEEIWSKLDLAKARRNQTRAAYRNAKAGLVGNNTNRIDAFVDVNKTHEERLAALRGRDIYNADMRHGERHAQRIHEANEVLAEIAQEKAGSEHSQAEAPRPQVNPESQDNGAKAA